MKTLMATTYKNEDDYLTPQLITVSDDSAEVLIEKGYYREVTEAEMTPKELKIMVDREGKYPLIVPIEHVDRVKASSMREATSKEVEDICDNVGRLMEERITENFEMSRAFSEVLSELKDAVSLFGPLKSLHEAYGVIAEEFHEFEEQVFMKQINRDRGRARAEACQMAAMSIRTMIDCLT